MNIEFYKNVKSFQIKTIFKGRYRSVCIYFFLLKQVALIDHIGEAATEVIPI